MKFSGHGAVSRRQQCCAVSNLFASAFVMVLLLLGGCTSVSKEVSDESPPIVSESLDLLSDELVADHTIAPSPDSFLELPVEFQRHIETEILPLESEEERFFALKNWTFRKFGNEYEYDPTYTSSLSGLPDSERINCFSFSIAPMVSSKGTSQFGQ